MPLGIKTLERIARTLSDDVWVVAPETNQSGAAHSLTLTRPLRVRRHGERHFSVDGTPTDCVLIALQRIVEGEPVDLMLSGINHGANLGEDITYSGTVAAAMEATLFKVPSIAFSQVCESRQHIRWPTAERFAPEVIERLLSLPWTPDVLINVNFPDLDPDAVQGVRVSRPGRPQDRRHADGAHRSARRALSVDRRPAGGHQSGRGDGSGGGRGGLRLGHAGPSRHDPSRQRRGASPALCVRLARRRAVRPWIVAAE